MRTTKVDANGDPVLVNNRLIPVFSTFESLIENWIPSRGARVDINTTSFFINDTWALNDHLSFNLGVRGELVSSAATPGDITTVDTRAIVPRLAASYDPFGDGRYSIQATYSQYSGKYSEAQFAENTNVGNPSLLFGYYVGPPHECPGLPNATAVDCPGLDPANYVTFLGRFPTQNVFTDERLNSPVTEEFTLLSGATLGTRGYFQATYVRRRARSFVENYQDLTTGTTTLTDSATGDEYGTFTNKIYRNPGDLRDAPDVLQRNYAGLQFETRYQVFDDLLLNGSWTIQLRERGEFRRRGDQRARRLVGLRRLAGGDAAGPLLPLGGSPRRLPAAPGARLGHLHARHGIVRRSRHRRLLAVRLGGELQPSVEQLPRDT